MVLIDAYTRQSNVYMLLTSNMTFARLLTRIISLQAQFLDYAIKIIHLDNVNEFTSQTFNDYYMSIGITVEHLISHVHIQHGLAIY